MAPRRRPLGVRVGIAMLASTAMAGCSAAPSPSTTASSAPSPSALITAPASPTATVVPSATAAPTAAATLTPAPTLPATAAPVPTALTGLAGGWEVVSSPPGATLGALVAGGPGLVAAGCHLKNADGECASALVMTSPDGLTWREVALPGAAGAWVWTLQKVGAAVYAIGARSDEAAAEFRAVLWRSLDGVSWTLLDEPSFIGRAVVDLVPRREGSLATGVRAPYASEYGGFEVWRFLDGSPWQAPVSVEVAGQFDGYGGAVWTGTEFLAWGPLGDEVSEVPHATVFMTSKDGVAWTARPKLATFSAASLLDIHVGMDGLTAVGQRSLGEDVAPAAWRSIDGRTWTAAKTPDERGRMTTVATDSHGLIARGTVPSGDWTLGASWRSTDGASWTRLPAGADVPALERLEPTSPVTIGSRRCVAATLYADRGLQGYIMCTTETQP